MKKALFYDPYLDTLGGGERYTLTLAQILSQQGFEVEFVWDDNNILKKAEKRFGLDLSKIKVNKKAKKFIGKKSTLLDRFKFTRKYDLVFYLSDGSIPFLFSKKNLIHIQIPLKTKGNKFLNYIKSLFIHKFVYNSQFTKTIAEKGLPQSKGIVLYPPISTQELSSDKKRNLILSVGRFDPTMQNKRHDILIKAFRQLSAQTKNKYTLIIAGGVKGKAGKKVIKKLKILSKNLKVKILTNPEFDKLKELYSQSKIFWHSAGYGISESKFPEKMEHFGMTTVEAMASGAVPVVINLGGQKEIITKKTGFLWDTIPELVNNTLTLIKSPRKMDQMSKNAQTRAKKFSVLSFTKNIKDYLF